MQRINHIVYNADYPDQCQLDLYLPEDAGRRQACILFIHGGGWYKGEPNQFREVAEYFCGLGYTCASMGYRLAPVWKYPSQIEDSQAAFRYLQEQASRYGYSPRQIITWGSSAGGYLAIMLALQTGGPAAVVAYCPVVKLEERHSYYVGEDASLYETASPIHMVKKGLPPFLFIQGDADALTPLSTVQRMHENMLQLGNSSTLKVLTGTGHGFGYGIHTKDQQLAVQASEQFLHHLFA